MRTPQWRSKRLRGGRRQLGSESCRSQLAATASPPNHMKRRVHGLPVLLLTESELDLEEEWHKMKSHSWEFPNLVVSNMVVCIFAPFCSLLRSFADLRLRSLALIYTLLRSFACFCERLRLERPRLDNHHQIWTPSPRNPALRKSSLGNMDIVWIHEVRGRGDSSVIIQLVWNMLLEDQVAQHKPILQQLPGLTVNVRQVDIPCMHLLL